MSLFNTIKTGATGLGASGSSLAVIGPPILPTPMNPRRVFSI